MTYWTSPLHSCDICHNEFKSVMYDAKISSGPWGNLCQSCFDEFDCSLGLGRGQKYELQPNGRWLLTEGSR